MKPENNNSNSSQPSRKRPSTNLLATASLASISTFGNNVAAITQKNLLDIKAQFFQLNNSKSTKSTSTIQSHFSLIQKQLKPIGQKSNRLIQKLINVSKAQVNGIAAVLANNINSGLNRVTVKTKGSDTKSRKQAMIFVTKDHIFGALASVAIIGCLALLKKSWNRIPTADQITQKMFDNKVRLHGYVVKVGDGDNFRLYHTPFLQRLLPFKQPPSKFKKFTDSTIHIRLAGMDAPECAHFGLPGQKFGPAAKQWLTEYLLHRHVEVVLHRRDQYGRAVASVYVRKGVFRIQKNVSIEMVKAGYGVVYRGMGAEYNGVLKRLEKAQEFAQSRLRGMWKDGVDKVIGPQEYKKAFKAAAAATSAAAG